MKEELKRKAEKDIIESAIKLKESYFSQIENLNGESTALLKEINDTFDKYIQEVKESFENGNFCHILIKTLDLENWIYKHLPEDVESHIKNKPIPKKYVAKIKWKRVEPKLREAYRTYRELVYYSIDTLLELPEKEEKDYSPEVV